MVQTRIPKRFRRDVRLIDCSPLKDALRIGWSRELGSSRHKGQKTGSELTKKLGPIASCFRPLDSSV